jgi:hypothetical protein
MSKHQRLTSGVLAGLATSAAWLIAMQEPLALGQDHAAQSAAGKIDWNKAPSKEASKPSGKDDPKPGPYPEDPLLAVVERNYKGSATYRWLNVALQATAREHERYGGTAPSAAPPPRSWSCSLAAIVSAIRRNAPPAS